MKYNELAIITMLSQLMKHVPQEKEKSETTETETERDRETETTFLNLYPQVLYMHTKGISYATIYPQIEEWRHFMTYFMIEKHKSAYHILRSGEYDVFGVNYGPEPRMLSGNFWWATTSYISSLPPLTYEKAMKYSAELWLFESVGVNVYHPFISNKNHAFDRFPRYCYADVQDFYATNGARFLENREQYQYMIDVAYVPSYDVWKYFCVMLYEVQYRNIHKLSPLITSDELKEKTLFDTMSCLGGRKSSRLKREKLANEREEVIK
jgi:hypothetical protein